MTNEVIISVLVGLTGACGNNGKTENTDRVVMDALISCFKEGTDTEAVLSAVRQEKHVIAPGCESCATPCGNSSDYDMGRFHANDKLKTVKVEMLREAAALADRIRAAGETQLPDEIYTAIAFFGYELEKISYINLTETLKHMEV